MKGLLYTCLLFLLPFFSLAQQITYSDVLNENSRDMYYHIIGKVSGNILILKNQPNKYSVSIYQANMELKDKISLDFIPSKTFNIEFIEYRDSFYLIYQYKQKGIVYCMAAKMDGNVNKIGEPILLDTTKVGATGDEKIYTVITSEDKEKIMVFKIQEKDDKFNFVTLLYDKQLQLIHKTRRAIDYNGDNDVYSDFHLDNEGNLIFARTIKVKRGDDLAWLDLITKATLADTFSIRELPLNNWYIDEIKIKVDNVNKRYLLNSFYYVERRGNIEGIYVNVWDAKGDSSYSSWFTPMADSIRIVAKESGSVKDALNDFFIRNILLKRDGGYILVAEDYSKQSYGNNQWNRYDYLYPSRYGNYYNSFSSPYYGGYYNPYRPYNNYYNYNNYNNTTRHYYYNILIFSVSNTGVIEWSSLAHKDQSSDNSDNFLSFTTINTGPMLHFLFNSSDKKDPVLIDDVITADGKLTRKPPLKSYARGYEFMIRFAKRTGARELIVPCSYRGQVCFAKINF
jgi:hypothetical protein